MSDTTSARASTASDILWRLIIIGIFAIGVIMAVAVPLLNGNWRSIFAAAPVFAFGILIAAIRSIRR
ncbi:hypothetical protein WDU99_00190 [Microbacterium sp. Mu-80]|uniref:Uncharacterized protein n=1 Tax=Microbacterium bandirmense TaxID=3122050 RepID=A0ABU8L6X9_9MICO